MNRDQLNLKLTDYTDKYNKVIKALQEYEVLAQKLQGAIEAIDNLLKDLDKENNE